ncbi:gamma-glutamyl-gamma-aminobutyrate hydrolase family protein [Patulibacter sp.]|uniref:gamma-glutamyl-gamma-aminobutyrate hydrolase family protein n=1 Tax=Patulibacter sp. TaxID=1912859 RepID=UPI002726637C|nr:gamma-glutamyl-gamma-aminobutyrate hydrolase family protein [Patulibacter sp.]MDO9408958.1 gamma-glutamyl-gamma-aminobutyrate hydrolase family protein [Patulibacter sp.]
MSTTEHPDAAGVVVTTPRPVVGVTCAHETIRHGESWQQPADFVPASYVAAIQRAGGRAVLLPVDPVDAAHPEEVLAGLHGLILTGGVDLSPASYGAEPHPATNGETPERDVFEMALSEAAQNADLPLLAICRGMQIVAAAGGGTLLQHLPEVLGTDEHRRVPGTLDERNAHDVELTPGSLAARAIGAEVASVRSHHHQALDRVQAGWRVTGRAIGDALTEAIERDDRTFCLGVQWHPEGDARSAVIAALVDAARTRAGAARPEAR